MIYISAARLALKPVAECGAWRVQGSDASPAPAPASAASAPAPAGADPFAGDLAALGDALEPERAPPASAKKSADEILRLFDVQVRWPRCMTGK